MASTHTTFPLTGPIDLVLRLGVGTVTVTAKDDLAEAAVRLAPRGSSADLLRRFSVEMDGSTLKVTGPRQGSLADVLGGLRRERHAVDVEVDVPTATPVRIASASQEITVVGRVGDTDIATGSARLVVGEVEGDLRLRYGRAEATVGGVTGSVQLRAGAGTARFGEVGGAFECGFGTGELVLDVVRGSVRSRAGSGSVRVGAAHGDVDLTFGSGPITVGLPEGVTAHVDVTSGSGQVHSELPVEQAPRTSDRSISVRARTGSGEVRLRRADAA